MLKREKIFITNSNRKVKFHLLHPLPCTHFMEDPWPCTWCIFSYIQKIRTSWDILDNVLSLPPEKIYATALFICYNRNIDHSTLPKHDLWTLTFSENFSNIEKIVWIFFSKINISRNIIITVIIFSRWNVSVVSVFEHMFRVIRGNVV